MPIYLRLGSLVRSGLKYLKTTPTTPSLETTTTAGILEGRSLESSALCRRKKKNSVLSEPVVKIFKNRNFSLPNDRRLDCQIVHMNAAMHIKARFGNVLCLSSLQSALSTQSQESLRIASHCRCTSWFFFRLSRSPSNQV